jgi:tetratricopeptide (TPR) repeat protein
LEGWGLTRDRLRFALLDLADFLRVHRVRRFHDSLADGPNENRYEIAHEAFLRFVRQDAVLAGRLRDAHAVIARAALARHAGRWEALDPADEADLYDLRHVLQHARQAGIPEAEDLARDGGYADACFEAVVAAWDAGRHHIAVELADTAVPLFEATAASASGASADEVANALAGLLSNASRSLTALGRAAEALEALDRAENIFRRLTATPEGFLAYGANLGRTVYSRITPLSDQGRFEDALLCSDEVAAIRERLLAAGQPEDQRDELGYLDRRGAVLMRLERYEEAERCFAAVAVALRRLAAEGTTLSREFLVEAVIHHGNALNMLGRQAEAIACYSEAIASSRRLAQQERNAYLDLRVARALVIRAVSNWGETPLPVRLADLDEAIAIYRRLVDDEGRPELAADLVDALLAKGCAGPKLGDVRLWEQALNCYEQAAVLQRGLAQEGRAVEAVVKLGFVLAYRASAAIELDRWGVALTSFAEAIATYREAALQGFGGAASELTDRLLSSVSRRLCREIWLRPELGPGALPAFARALLEAAETCRAGGRQDGQLKAVIDEFVENLMGLAEGERARMLAALDGAAVGPLRALLTRPESERSPDELERVADRLTSRAGLLRDNGHTDAALACLNRAADLRRRVPGDRHS